MFHNYPGVDDDAKWESFLVDLESLPSEFKVIGVNDYIFIEGYKRLKEEKSRGRIPNIELLLPVIELRLDKFGGTASHFSKVNFHVIFSEEVDADLIKDQFLAGLWTEYILAPHYLELKKRWKAHPTRDSIADLGKLIIESAPEAERAKFSSDLEEGFNSLTFAQDRIVAALDKPYFEDKYLFAVGKTEWANIKWNDNSIADKKNVINSVDMVFTAAATPDGCQRSTASLKQQAVNYRLFDCSDAHWPSSSTDKDRVGNCFTWIKADPTFAGLKHSLLEFDDRVFLGELPPKLKEVHQNQTHYIKSITFRKLAGSPLDEAWFEGEIPINQGLVAIIGNKGSGKSALADTIGLLGNSHQDKSFSFLSEARFRDPKDNKARQFEAFLTWESGPGKTKSLDARVGQQEVELVKYIPQNFLELICNETETKRETDFDKELKKVIFSHVPEEERLSQDSLDSLLTFKTGETYQFIEALRDDLQKINLGIVRLEETQTPEYRQQIQNNLETKLEQLRANESIKPVPVPPPSVDASEQATASLLATIDGHKKTLSELARELQKASTERSEVNRLIGTANRVIDRIENIRKAIETFRKDSAADLNALGFVLEDVVQVRVDPAPVIEKRTTLLAAKTSLDDLLSPSNTDGLPTLMVGLDSAITSLQSKLDEPSQRHQAYLKQLEEWTSKQAAISGDESTPDTLIYFRNLLDQIDEIPPKLTELKSERLAKSREIFQRISGLANTYRELYRAVKEFIQRHPIAKDELQLNFDVSIIDTGFENRFFDQVSRGVTGSFCGLDEGQKMLRDLLKKVDFNKWENVKGFIEEILDYLEYDRRSAENVRVRIETLLRKGYGVAQLYDYIFSLDYLQPKYTLKLGDKELSQLSPGEKGALLLIFYFLVDRGQIPLVVDQPEENLDNETMFKLLVPCLKEAKNKRQVIIVTHNPNLAVVSDAEQIIHSTLDKSNKNRLTYTPGALENPVINRKVLDVLEGTRPAFDNRAGKYLEESA